MTRDDRGRGYVYLHRAIIDWEWYSDVNTRLLFIHLILSAEYKNRKCNGRTIRRGQYVTSIRKLSREAGISEANTRTALEHLKSTHEITCQSSPQGTVITVKNYEKYQMPAQPSTHDQHTRPENQHTTNTPTSNKDNKKKESGETRALRGELLTFGEFENVKLSQAEVDKLKALCPGGYLEYIERLSGYMASKGKRYKNHYATIRNWIRRDGKTDKEDDDEGII